MDLTISPRTRGRAETEVLAEIVRDLAVPDLALLAQERGTKAPSLKRIHSSHHALARCLACGMKPHEASLVTGYSQSRVSILKADPAFQALVAEYAEDARGVFADFAERMSNISLDLIEVLHERLQDDPDSFTVPQILEALKTFADRTGHGPRATQVNVNVDLAGRLASGRARAGLATPAGRALPPPPAVAPALGPPSALEPEEVENE